MIAKDDGARFKRAIVAALRKHLSFSQIMTTAALDAGILSSTEGELIAEAERLRDAVIQVSNFDPDEYDQLR